MPEKNEKNTVSAELEALRLEREKLEFEKLKAEVEAMKAAKASKEINHKSRERDLQEFRKRHEREQAICKHRKGGMNSDGIFDGEDGKFSVNKHTYPWGETVVMCTRCLKEWHPGDTEYAEAMRWPTDNQPSAAAQFSIPKA